MLQRRGGARDAAGQVEIEEKVLAERFAGAKIEAADDLAQRWQRRG
jgi:hypothetical protein